MKNKAEKNYSKLLEVLGNAVSDVRLNKGSEKLIEALENEYRETKIQISVIQSGIKRAKRDKSKIEFFQSEERKLRKSFLAEKHLEFDSLCKGNSSVILNCENCDCLAEVKEKYGFEVEFRSKFGILFFDYSPKLDFRENRTNSMNASDIVGTILQELKASYGYITL